MSTILARVSAALFGLLLLVLALIGTVGTAVFIPIGMLIWARRARRRGMHLGLLQSWLSGIVPFAVVAILAIGIASVRGPLRQSFAQIEQVAADVRQHPPPPPEILRQFGAAPAPVSLPPAVETALGVVGMIIGVEFACAFVGTIGWAGTRLLVFGARGRRPSDVPPLTTTPL